MLRSEAASVSTEALASLGEGQIAYVKQIRSEDVPGLFPQAPKIAPGLKLFALHAADGTPIMLTDSREAAIANAWSTRAAGRERALTHGSCRRVSDAAVAPSLAHGFRWCADPRHL